MNENELERVDVASRSPSRQNSTLALIPPNCPSPHLLEQGGHNDIHSQLLQDHTEVPETSAEFIGLIVSLLHKTSYVLKDLRVPDSVYNNQFSLLNNCVTLLKRQQKTVILKEWLAQHSTSQFQPLTISKPGS